MSVQRRSVLGVVFLIVGLTILAVELWAHKRLDTLHAMAGFGPSLLGAWLIDAKSTSEAVGALASTVRGFVPSRNATPPPPPPPPESEL